MKYARLMDCLQPVVSGVALIGLWYVAKAAFGIPTFVLPSPEEILRAAWEERRPLLSAAMVTVRGAVLGFFLAVSAAFWSAVCIVISGPFWTRGWPEWWNWWLQLPIWN